MTAPKSSRLFKYPLGSVRNNAYHIMAWLRRTWLTRFHGMTIGQNTRISGKARLDYTNPKGVHIGSHTQITFDVAILTHDFVNRRHVNTHIGNYCFIGAGSIVMPGITVGDHCIVGAGSVVTRDVPAHSIVAGNPARIRRSGIQTIEYGILDPDAPAAATGGADTSSAS